MINSTYNCKHCGTESKWSYQKLNVYCSNACSAEGRLTESIEKVKQGLVTERPTIRKVLAKLRGYKCEVCSLTEWQGEKITLQVDHTDGNAGNNALENLRIICPNCHSQTKTFGGGNKGSGRVARGLPRR